MSVKISEDTAKRSIHKFESLIKTKVKEVTTFVTRNTTNGVTTPALKRKANSLIAELEGQFKRMEERWNTWSLGLETDFETTFLALEIKFEGAEKAVSESVESIHGLIDRADEEVQAPNANGVQNGNPQRASPKLVTDFRPGILPNSANLSEFNAWEKSFLANMDCNTGFLASADAPTKRVFITSLLDDKLQAALDVDEDMKEDAIAIKAVNDDDKSILGWLRGHILRYQPLYIRRYHYSLVKQHKNESFADFLTRKVLKAREAEIEKIDSEAVQITELITGVINMKLREEFLKLKNPKLTELVDLGLKFDLAEAVRKQNFGEVSANKTSEYQNLKKQNWNDVQ